MFTGLEYIINFEQKSKKDYADQLGIRKQQLNSWIKGDRPIPKKWLEIFSQHYRLDESIFTKDLSGEEELTLLKHLLELNGVQSKNMGKGVETMELLQKRLELHARNVTDIQNLLMDIHRATVKEFGLENPQTPIETAAREEEYIQMVEKFIRVIRTGDGEKRMVLDWILHYLTTVDKVDMEELAQALTK